MQTDALRIMSINCTVLTRARLTTILDFAQSEDANCILLQETRHHATVVPWASGVAAKQSWCIHFSAPPPLDRMGRRSQGGTAVLWRRDSPMGKAAPVPVEGANEMRHRIAAVSFKDCIITSVYGPAHSANTSWFASLFPFCTRLGKSCSFLIGDFNFKPCYDSFVPNSWTASAAKATTQAGSAPTRALASVAIEQVRAVPLPGIPHHFAVIYIANFPDLNTRNSQTTRLKRCAAYRWVSKPPTEEQLAKILHTANSLHPQLSPKTPLTDRWRRWHERAEGVFLAAVELGLAVKDSSGERPKGSFPEVRPCAPGQLHRGPQTVLHRRLLRVHRAVAELVRQGYSVHAQLPPNLGCRLDRVLFSAVGLHSPSNCTIEDALSQLNPAIRKEDDKLSQQASKHWRRHFTDFSHDTWHAAKQALNPPQLRAAFSAADMRADWAKHWCPTTDDSHQATQAWREIAAATNFRSAQPCFEQPSRSHFAEALLSAKGSAGSDGWLAHEAALLQRYFTPLADELFDLWKETLSVCSTETELPQDLAFLLWSWKVVGVPKKTEFDSRPISVGSVLLRAWHRTLLKHCPQPPKGQWCGRKNCSVAHATADFFSAGLKHFAESDLSKAFDHLWPPLAEEALTQLGAPQRIAEGALTQLGAPQRIAKALRRAWQGPRFCSVSGGLAVPLVPTRGVPQGCPCSPLGLAATLGPWSLGVEKLDPLLKTWAFMDDRSIGVLRQGSRALLQAALQYTTTFDQQVGFEINEKKTQIYFEGSQEPSIMEHLGLRHDPARLDAPVTSREPNKRKEVVDRLRLCPGTIQVRSRLTTAFVRPLDDWASPFMAPGTSEDAKALFRAISHASTTWWCYGRFWCQQVDNHPAFGVAIRGLCCCPAFLQTPSPQLTAVLKRHAEVLHLKISRTTSQALWVKN